MIIEIEKMSLDDLDKIKEILISDFDDFWNYNILKQELQSKTSHLFIAKNEQEDIIGFACVQFVLDEASITNIVTRKKYRNQGVGSALLNKLISFSEENNMSSITLEVNENNRYAIMLYNKFGFKTSGMRKNYYNGMDNAIIMEVKF